MGDNSYIEKAKFTNYISKIKQRLISNKASIGINEDIDESRILLL